MHKIYADMILFPNAKINIGLNIVSRREDGYHNIETVMYPIGWSDVLEIVPARGNDATLTVTGREVNCPPEKNLVMKAFRLFQENTGIGNVDIYLHKIIPDGAGLGGGSADAAFTLIGLNKMFECNLNNEQLAAMAAKIGADCPFFIYNTPMLATGIGTLAFFASIIYALIIIIKHFIFGADVAGYDSIVALILMFGGLQLLCVGNLGEYLAKGYVQVKNRPVYIISKMYSYEENK